MALLSGLQTQCEISQLLDEFYGDLSLSYPNEREGRKRCYTSQGAAKHLEGRIYPERFDKETA